ncbi:hypothetical protein NLG97_g991 [Lecanicillium saksenae]|uniref:Uncharacterized protein n=1 Tax=Lecanicillium saksenae TaxID=468837 RepID=A0ACC1R6T3_9HYPO|nr:hypothetical protein NLG97_g991 [Lecanicillium saksenae]
MAPSARALPLRASLLLGLSAFARHAAALDLSFCADINTASGSTNTSNLQSNGLCHDFCSGYVYSITYQENCWCANDVPAKGNMLDLSDCNFPCLGYPFENCGGKGNDVYGYVSLGPQPSGTKSVGGGASPTSKPVSPLLSLGLSLLSPFFTAIARNIFILPTSNLRRFVIRSLDLSRVFSGLDHMLVLAGVVTKESRHQHNQRNHLLPRLRPRRSRALHHLYDDPHDELHMMQAPSILLREPPDACDLRRDMTIPRAAAHNHWRLEFLLPRASCKARGMDGMHSTVVQSFVHGFLQASHSSTKASSSIVQTVTVGGKVTTIIVTPTATGDSSKDGKPVPAGGSGLGGGAIAGIVIGAVAGIALIGLLIWFLLRRRKQNEDDEFRDDPSVRGSSRGRMGSHQHDLSIAGSAASPGSAGNRSSMLQVDPRMDPFKQGLYMRNGSAESVNTLRDDHDYSRRIQAPKVLRATNPDPET